jgi:hypothetical protein
MPTPNDLLAVLDEERSLSRQLSRRKAVAIRTFYPLKIPTAVSFPFSHMNMRWMRMVVRKQENPISLQDMTCDTRIGEKGCHIGVPRNVPRRVQAVY